MSTPSSRSAVLDERRRVRVDAREQPVGRLDERHLRADAREELRELAADRAAAEHERASAGTSSVSVASTFVQ